VPEIFLYSYLATFSNLTGLLWYFMCAALRCAAMSLEETLFKARHNSSTVCHNQVLLQLMSILLAEKFIGSPINLNTESEV
jgi:hypothetical protein